MAENERTTRMLTATAPVDAVVRRRGEIAIYDRVRIVATGEIGIAVGINWCDPVRKYGVRTSRGLDDYPRRSLSVRMTK